MARRRQATRKLQIEVLESRQLLSRGGARTLPLAAVASAHPIGDSAAHDSRPDLDAFARNLVEHPQAASKRGLGALAMMLDQHAGYAARHGWGGCLAMVLARHPRYAARHHLKAMLRSSAAPLQVVAGSPGATNPADPTATVAAPTQTGSILASASPSSPVTTAPTAPADPAAVTQVQEAVTVGGTLDVTLRPGNLAGADVAYIITPQPLPANMTFNRGTGELVFAPAPGQSGTYQFSIQARAGSRTATDSVRIAVTQPKLATTEVSGQVVDEAGKPLAGMPVSLGDATAVTDLKGGFTLAGVSADPGPISAGGSVADAVGRLNLKAPLEQLLGHAPYDASDNVIPTPLILPKIAWSAASSFGRTDGSQPLKVTNPTIPGFAIQLPKGSLGRTAASGTLQVAELSPAESAQHMPPGLSAPMVLVKSVGLDLTQSVQLTLPNLGSFKPGAMLNLYRFNNATGGNDVVGQMVVSADGKSMTSTGAVTLASGTAKSTAPASGTLTPFDDPPPAFLLCLKTGPASSDPMPITMCAGCQQKVASTAAPSNSSGGGDGPVLHPGIETAMASDAGLATGEYFQDHQTVTYQSQGQDRGIDLQYSSGQAYPHPVVQYQSLNKRNSTIDIRLSVARSL